MKARRRRLTLLPQVLLLPAVVLFLLFTVAPGGYAIYLSFMKQKAGGGLFGTDNPTTVFAGLENYRAAFGDAEFWHSIGRMLLVAVIGVPATIGFSTLFALCLDAKRARLVGFSRLAIFLPYAVPGVVATLLWGFMYLPATSPIGGNVVNYFGSHTVFFAVANVAVWGVLGFNMVVIYTSLRGLPRELFQAAELDGASELQIALRIKLPLLAPTLTLVTVFSLIGAPAVQRADHAQAGHQRDQLDLGALDARLHRRLRRQRHLPRGGRLVPAHRADGHGHRGRQHDAPSASA